MLLLTRRPGEHLVLTHGDLRIEVWVSSVRGQQVRIGVQAPKEVHILRDELEGRAPLCSRCGSTEHHVSDCGS